MPRHKRPRAVNQLAKSIIDGTTGGVPAEPPAETGKDPAAVSLGRRGGLKGGPARAKKLGKKKLSEAAKRAARARWGR